MASGKGASPTLRVTWSQKLTDFALVLKSGDELKCHKFVLAENSEVFEAMLNKDYLETSSSRMKVDHFEEEAVYSFLQYLYAPVRPEEMILMMRRKDSVKDYVYQRHFSKEKLTVELFRMAHLYQVKDLLKDCEEYLKSNLCDENVMNVWAHAEMCNNDSLSKSATKFLASRPNGGIPLHEVPGFEEAFESHKQARDLLKVMSEQNSMMREEIKDWKEMQRQLQGIDVIFKITVTGRNGNDLEWTEEMFTQPKGTESLASFLARVEIKRPLSIGRRYMIKGVGKPMTPFTSANASASLRKIFPEGMSRDLYVDVVPIGLW